MISKESVGTIAELLLILLIVGPVLGQFLGQPILLSYVETDSMSPTMEPDDGFVAIPRQLAGSIEEGDVVVFDAEELHDGGLVTHRVVGRTEAGYVTKGDGNPFADQQGKEPPVTKSQIVAVGLQIGGHLVVVPEVGKLGTAVDGWVTRGKVWLYQTFGVYAPSGPSGMLVLISVLLGLVYAYDALKGRRSDSSRPDSRNGSRNSGTDTRFAVAVLTVLLLTSATVTMVAPSGQREVPAAPTETETGNYSVKNGGVIPIVAFVGSDTNVSVEPAELHVDQFESRNASVTVPPARGGQKRTITEHRYLAILPPSSIRSLYHFHPWAPIVAIDALIGIPFYLIGIRLIGTGRIRDRSRERALPVIGRLRRMVRDFY
jgi:signal peptidase